jgi:integrase
MATEPTPKKARTPGRIEKRGKDKYLLRVYTGTDGNGKRRYINKTFHGTSKQAQKALRQMLLDKDLGLLSDAGHISLDDYLDQWLDTVKPNVRPKSYKEYAGALKRYVRPVLGAKKLSSIKPVDIQAVYTAMQAKGIGLSIRQTHVILKDALEQAVKWQMLSRNPADYVDLPKRGNRKEMYALNRDEVNAFLQAAKTDKWFTLFSLMLHTGLRPSEALGLTWRDLDLGRGTLTVRQGLSRFGGEWLFQEPKSVKSRRTIPLLLSDVKLLSEHMARQQEESWENPHNLVFLTEFGEPTGERGIVKDHFKPALTRAKLPSTVRLYDLRHTHATLLLLAGVHPKVVSERLGHANITITLDTYSHVLPNMQQEALTKLEGLMASAPVTIADTLTPIIKPNGTPN